MISKDIFIVLATSAKQRDGFSRSKPVRAAAERNVNEIL